MIAETKTSFVRFNFDDIPQCEVESSPRSGIYREFVISFIRKPHTPKKSRTLIKRPSHALCVFILAVHQKVTFRDKSNLREHLTRQRFLCFLQKNSVKISLES